MAAYASPPARRVLADVETLLPVISKFLAKKNRGNWIQTIVYHARILSMEKGGKSWALIPSLPLFYALCDPT